MSYRTAIDLQRSRSRMDAAEHEWSVSEVNHRVANSFSLLAGVVTNQARHVKKDGRSMSPDEVSSLLNEIGSRITAAGRFHRQLATAPDDFQVDLNQHLWDLCTDLIETFARPGQFELMRSEHEACVADAGKILPICLIVTEVVSNALKYAHPTGVRGTITLGCRRKEDGSLLVEIADDGVGLPDGFDPAVDGSIGCQTVRLLAASLGAEAAFVSGPIGLYFQLRLPREAVH